MMSLTMHSEEVSTATASSSSSPSPTSSHTHDETDHTSSILFSSLIVFLSIFGVAMLGGIVIHYVMARWRQLLREELENIKQCRLRRQKPKMWDVRPELSASPNHQPKWGALNVSLMSNHYKDNFHFTWCCSPCPSKWMHLPRKKMCMRMNHFRDVLAL